MENLDEGRNRKDSLINPLQQATHMKFEAPEEPQHDFISQQQVMHSSVGQGDLSMMGGYHQSNTQHMMTVNPHTQSLQAALSPFGFGNEHQRAFMMNEFSKRENDRKTSMSFGYGGSFFT